MLASLELPPDPLRRNRFGTDLRTIRVLWLREVIRFGRNRLRVAMGLVSPLLFLLILGTGLNSLMGGGGFQGYLFPGVLLMAVQAPALAVGISIVWDRQSGFLRQMLVAPVRRAALVAGLCLGGATAGTLYGLLVLVLAGVAGIPYRPELLLVLGELVLVSFTFTAMGVLAAVCIKRIETFQVVINLALTPLLFLSGAVFPAGGLPGWLSAAVAVNPLAYAVDALRRTLPGDAARLPGTTGPQWWGSAPPLVAELGLVAALAAVALVVAARRFSRAE
ncbi:ABC transporter permease [Actinokineospora sp. NBRC 105648]|uniref:ABC transporter permease n=1 Tax=Actinokineospora sp. NBRC 105648 TaxID=3032206 RepID=UPI0024A15A42|nr:ABC transporter permease [Actinokineospora sp. NBRC 105648]GLZ37035.1 transport permease protein [Actinokineospora sp. NBRC 105648]